MTPKEMVISLQKEKASPKRIIVSARVNPKIYEEFENINKNLGISNSACINALIANYVSEFKDDE